VRYGGAEGGCPDGRVDHGVDRVGARGECGGGGEPGRVGEVGLVEVVGLGGAVFGVDKCLCGVAPSLLGADRGRGQDHGRCVKNTLRDLGVLHVRTVPAGGAGLGSSGWVTVRVGGWVDLPVSVENYDGYDGSVAVDLAVGRSVAALVDHGEDCGSGGPDRVGQDAGVVGSVGVFPGVDVVGGGFVGWSEVDVDAGDEAASVDSDGDADAGWDGEGAVFDGVADVRAYVLGDRCDVGHGGCSVRGITRIPPCYPCTLDLAIP